LEGDKRVALEHRRIQAVIEENGEIAVANPKSAVVWHYSQRDRNSDGKFNFEETFHRSMSIPVIKDNILYIADFSGLFHCLNAKTGKVYWTYDMLAQCWGSALLVDDKVYICDEDGDVTIFPHSLNSRPALEARATKDGRVEYVPIGARQGEPIAEINMGSSIYMTPIVANNVLYIASRSYLFAIAHDEP
jgi:outer membrane protein assembly factor BamB